MIRKFLQGTRPSIRGRLQAVTFLTLTELIEKAVNVEGVTAELERRSGGQGNRGNKFSAQEKQGAGNFKDKGKSGPSKVNHMVECYA